MDEEPSEVVKPDFKVNSWQHTQPKSAEDIPAVSFVTFKKNREQILRITISIFSTSIFPANQLNLNEILPERVADLVNQFMLSCIFTFEPQKKH